MKLYKLTTKEAEERLGPGWKIETNQAGIVRVERDGVVIGSDNTYSSLTVSVPAPPEKKKVWQVALTVDGKTIPLPDRGNFAEKYQAVDASADLPESIGGVIEVEVEE